MGGGGDVYIEIDWRGMEWKFIRSARFAGAVKCVTWCDAGDADLHGVGRERVGVGYLDR